MCSCTTTTRTFTLEKLIKNGAKSFNGSIEPAKAKGWTLNILMTFRAMEVVENHYVKQLSSVLEEEAAFLCSSEVQFCREMV